MTPPSLKRLRTGLLILGIIFLIAVLGYWTSGRSLIDSVYMVVITLSTVGYGDQISDMSPLMKVFTSFVIVVGVFTAFYILGGLVQMMAEGEINRALGLQRVTREIERLNDHVIICGFGRMGEVLARELKRQKMPLVVVENDPERIAEAASLGYLELQDDATEEEALLRAGVKRAKTLVTTLRRDADNVFITLTARNLNQSLQIIARGELQTTEKKLIQAGADRVVLPAATGALRMAVMITRPTVVELIEVVAGREITEVQVDEVEIPQDHALTGLSLRDSEIRSRHGLLIVAVRHPDGNLEFNPASDLTFPAEGSLVVIGRSEDIDRFRADYRLL